MRSLGQAETDQQFQVTGRYISNLDHCNRCGAPRSAHGPDWTCPGPPAPGAAMVPLKLGGLLTLGGLVLEMTSANPATAKSTATLLAILIGITLFIVGAIMARWPS